MKIIADIICAIKGHGPIENHLIETEGYICTKRCSRCKNIMMGGIIWKIKHIPPPNSTEEQIVAWEQYCEAQWQLAREGLN